ncbi:TonB-dependent receptor [Pedobacter frigidisoli]|uniref:SusC/RagA family TonB-linked outer membrane protein n=1 Tax=Pedobacter frigidisoli TaxID=2530455 RepID=UPI0029313386|nr:TonB-dependent receptor [Pedobacter frigidisoli]
MRDCLQSQGNVILPDSCHDAKIEITGILFFKAVIAALVLFLFTANASFATIYSAQHSLSSAAPLIVDRTVTGIVKSGDDNLPIPGAVVRVKGTSLVASTNSDGKFTIKVPAESTTLVFSYLGYETKEILLGASNSVNVTLTISSAQLADVVVVAFGTATRESLVGAVAQVNADDLGKRPITNAMAALEGAAPGIQVNNTSGQPGAEPTVRIRGFTTINGSNTPLYVIDGVVFGGNVSDINPADIESISVLKDASATTLYGNRASNGVIIMTTKKGRKGSSSLNLIANQGFYNRGIKEYEKLNANEYMEAMWQGYKNYLLTSDPTTYSTAALAGARATSNLISDYLKLNIYDKPSTQLFDSNGKLRSDASILPGYSGDLDWYEGSLRTGHRQDYTLNATNSNEKSNLFYSIGYLNEKGYITNADFKRLTGRINADIQAKKWLKYGFNLSGSHQKTNLTNGSTSSAGSYTNVFNYARQIAPIYPVHLHDITTGEYTLDASGNQLYDDGTNTRNQYVGRHSIWENDLNKDTGFRNTLAGQAYVDIKFLKDFTFTVKGDLNVRNDEEQTYDNALIGDGAGNAGRASRTTYRYKNYTAQQLLNWEKKIGLHTFDALVGHENYYYNYNYLYGYKTTETFANATELVNFNNITNLTDYQVDYRTEGYFSRGRYNYDNKYFLEASFRRDASSRFYSGSRWGNFWSVGGSWIISKEAFFKPLATVVNNLKLRTSYGEVGNDSGAGYYSYYDLYALRQNANKSALTISQFGNKDLKWETSSSFGAAIEGRLFDRVNFSAEYFDKGSQNLLFDLNLPLSAGGTSTSAAESVIQKNVGSISNRGLELALDVDIIKSKDWNWNVGVNATFMKNKIVRLADENSQNGIVSGLYKYMEGHGVYDFWTYQYVGVDQMTGNSLYLADTQNFNVAGSAPGKTDLPSQYLVNINGQYYTTYTTYAKRDWSGSAIPDVYGSFSTNLNWKNFSLSGIFTYALGGKTYDYSYASLMSMSGSVSALHKDLLSAWSGVPAGMTATSADRIDPNGIPVIDYARSDKNNATSSRFLQDGSYLVIKNIAVGYQLPASFTNKFDVSSVKVNFGIENLFTFTKLQGMNPQQSFAGTSQNAYVTPRVFSLGINVGF